MMDVALHKLLVVFVLDRSGITGEDGSSHHGVYDVTWLREIPNPVIASPRDGNELRRALATAIAHTAGRSRSASPGRPRPGRPSPARSGR